MLLNSCRAKARPIKAAELRSPSQAGLHLQKYQSSRRCQQFPLKSNLKK
ncbi:hypothetical protein PTUN_a2604 [Pseudoalteromonas tunicata]|nr:hypothetical protein PTUN_a2604 [Pseudoalteromonas tunicata]